MRCAKITANAIVSSSCSRLSLLQQTAISLNDLMRGSDVLFLSVRILWWGKGIATLSPTPYLHVKISLGTLLVNIFGSFVCFMLESVFVLEKMETLEPEGGGGWGVGGDMRGGRGGEEKWGSSGAFDYLNSLHLH